jgi:chromosome condensin MukBEF ATPase and DNA-binding subunit MukB
MIDIGALAEIFGGAGMGVGLTLVGFLVFQQLVKRAEKVDSTPQWLELANKTLEGFRDVTATLTALKDRITEETKERQKDSDKANELLSSLGSAMSQTLELVSKMMTEVTKMGDEAERRRALDSADTKTRYDALRAELENHNIRLTAIESAMQGVNTRLENLEAVTRRILTEISGIREAVVSDVRGVVVSLVKEAVELAFKERETAVHPPAPVIAPDTADAPPVVQPDSGEGYPRTPLPPPMKKEDAPQ